MTNDARVWRQQQTGSRCGAMSIAINNATLKRLHQHLQYQGTPTKEEGGAAPRRGLSHHFFSFFFSSLFLMYAWPSLGL
jgi:hypothetical protein